MQLAGSPVHQGPRLEVVATAAAVVLTTLLMAGCGGMGAGTMPTQWAGADSRTASERFRPEYDDYREISQNEARTRKWMAAHGLGALDREGDPLNRYLNGILQRIIRTSPVPDVPARVVTVDTLEGRAAYAAADGSIHIPYRLLADMDERPDEVSEDALAFLLAHELAHVLYAHEKSDVIGDIIEILVVVTEVGTTVAVEVMNFDEEMGAKAKATAEQAHKAATAGRWAEETFLSPAWTREQEEAADILAYDLVVRAGYNAGDGAAQFLDLLGLYEDAARRREESDDAGADPLDLGAHLVHLGSKVLDKASKSHPTVAGRKENLEDYVETYEARMGDEYQYIDVRELAWKEYGDRETLSDADAATVRKLFANFRSAHEAMEALDDNQRERATGLIEAALSAPTTYHATPRMVAARAAGKGEQSFEHLQLALRGPDPSFYTYTLVLRRLAEQGKFGDVLDLLEQAEGRFGPFVDLMRWRAAALERLDRTEEARAARSACYFENALDKRRSSCNTDIIR